VLNLDTALRLAGMRLGDRALIGPQVAQLDLTDACTNNCLGCWARSPLLRDEDHYDTLEKGAHDLAFVRRLLPALREARVQELFLGGGGDPLCFADLPAAIREAKAAGFAVTLNTNFTLADEALVESLIDAGLDHLIVSLWAGRSATYARLHPNKTEATFHHLTRLLARLAERKRERGSATPRVKLYEVICALNFEEIPEMIAHGRAVGAEEVEFAVLDPIPRRTDVFTLDKQQIARAIRLAAGSATNGRPFVHREQFVRRLQNIDAVKGVFDNGIVGSIPCAAGWFFTRITTVGQVHGCLKSHRIAAGDLRRQDFPAVWFGERQNEFRRRTLRLNYDDPWLRNIGHDIDFALPGCFRICDNLGGNQAVMRLAGSLSPQENAIVEGMAQAARRGAALAEVEAVYREAGGGIQGSGFGIRDSGFGIPNPQSAIRNPQSEASVLKFNSELRLHGDNEIVHEAADGAEPWRAVMRRLGELPPTATIRVPATIQNIARLERLFALIRDTTGRALDPAWAHLEPRPLAEIHLRWPATLAQARERAAAAGVALDLADDGWRQTLWKFAAAARGDNEAELLRALGAATGGVFVGPRTFHLDVTNRCDAECRYCWFHSPLAAARDDPHRLTAANRDAAMAWPTFLALADDLAQLGATEDVVLSGKGDPLTHPRLLDMVRALKDRRMNVTLFTGGLGLTEETIRALVDAELDMLYISLSAASETTFARLHDKLSPAAFGRLAAAARRLVDLRRAAKKEKPRLVLVDVVTALNDHEIVDFARLAAGVGADHVRYQLAAIESYNAELAVPPARRAALPGALAEARRIVEATGATVVENIDFQTGGHGEGANWTGERYRDVGCLAGWVFSRAWADGEVSFCCAPRPVGNLAERSFAAWWRSDEYDRLRLAARDMRRRGDTRMRDGGALWTDVCRRCPNYEGVERLRRTLAELDLPGTRR
jgi:MoaA/NifB/PqqE/SkfB family radical SAM enzyme